jgi:hypothetical protein
MAATSGSLTVTRWFAALRQGAHQGMPIPIRRRERGGASGVKVSISTCTDILTSGLPLPDRLEVSMSLVESVRAGLAELEPIDVRDRAVADLALRYAEHIDDDADWADKLRDPLAELGPKLLAALTALGMTPAARKGIVGDKPDAPKASPLDELRARRAARDAAG